MATGSTTPQSTDTVAVARQQFFSKQKVPASLVSRTILQSWLRCSQLGHDASRDPTVEPVGPQYLREAHEQHEMLRRLCQAEIESLRREARTTGGIVVLSDANGMVLDAVGDTAFAGKAAGVALRPGVAWSEASIGTNAIGTALVERRPVMVRGGEHFYEPHRVLSCAAAPIFDPRGAIAGVLDLSGSAATISRQSLSMVRLVIDQIEHRLFDQAFGNRADRGDIEMLRFHTERSLLGTARECILVFEGDRLIAANRHALQAISRGWDALGRTSFDALFDGGGSLGEEGTLRFHSGETVHYRLPRRGARRCQPQPRERRSLRVSVPHPPLS
ncbi:sigma-54-dependent Fis family transcriptional regulator [Pseudochelatococcus lubricantis]|uniref:sigma-54-dependent Fis family transcriptional regulator n=1 Tax=Pseudochelatococcus lubricantis TaxID=1538102 RepID=UPI0035ED4A70